MRKIYLMFGLALGITSMATAQGDNCASAVPVTPGSYVADGPATGGGGAVNTDWTSGFGGGVGNADWYSFTATCDGTMDVHSCAGGTDTDLFIYQDVCPASQAATIASDDDGCSLGCCASGVYGLPVTAGTTYYIEWGDEWDGGTFAWDLAFTLGGPTGLPSVPTNTTAAIDWTDASATAWVIEYGLAGFTPGTGTILNVSVTSDTVITGLNPLTAYDYYISTTGPCAATSGVNTFTTLPLCPEPTGLTTTPGVTNALFDWNPGGTEVVWDVEYGTAGVLLGAGTQAYDIILGSDTTVTGLSASTNYDWYVRAVCDLVAPKDTFSLWVGPTPFTTDPSCPAPTALDTAGGNPFTAGLTWTPGGLESNWNYEYGAPGFILGTGTMVSTGSPAGANNQITGLVPGQTIEFYVQADCQGALGTSAFTGPYTWTQPEYCADPSAAVFANVTANSMDFSWTPNGTESNWTIEYGINGFVLGTGTQVQTIASTESISGLATDTDYCFYVQANCGATPDSSSAWVGPFCQATDITCAVPTNLGAINITQTAANLIWIAGGSETAWAVEWGSPGFMPGTGASIGGVNPTSTMPYYATGLPQGAAIEFYVQAICGAADSSQWAGPYSFSTLCGTLMAPYNQDFDDVATGPVAYTPPTCWSNPNIGERWEFQVSGGAGPDYAIAGAVDHTTGTGNFAWIDASGNIGNNELISPMIDISALTSAQAGFYVLSNNQTDVAQNTITMEFWNGTGWTLLGTYGANNSEWVEVSYILPGSAPSVTQFRLVQYTTTVGGSAFYNDLLVDDFFVREEIPCPVASAGTAVTGPFCHDGTTDIFAAVTGATDDSGTFWFPSAAPGNQSFAATAGSLILTGLAADTDYTFDYVVNNGCDADTLSLIYNWSAEANSGTDGALSTCVNHDVLLIQELGGNVDFGGTWTDDDNAGGMVNGIFSPAVTAPGTYDFTYTVDNGTCSSSSVVTVTVEACAGVEENTIVMSVYPNPVRDNLTVNLTNVDANAIVELFTIQGQIVAAPTAINNSTINVNMSNVADGIYILKVTANGSTEEVRVVKK